MPCEVRFVRLPSSNRRLIRASITDITERKRAEAIAAGERRVFEKIAANAPLSSALESICELIERVIAESYCAINLLDHERQALNFGVAPRLPREFVVAMDNAPIGIRYGSCAAAVYLARQVTVADIESDAFGNSGASPRCMPACGPPGRPPSSPRTDGWWARLPSIGASRAFRRRAIMS